MDGRSFSNIAYPSIGCAVLCVILMLAVVQNADAQSAERVYRDYHASIVAIQTPLGTGSGFVVRSDGLIATNYHVIEGATRIQVVFKDNPSVHWAEAVGTDPTYDLALLRVQSGPRARPVRLGSTRRLPIGSEVIAIGNPLGLDASVSTGIVSQVRVLQGLSFMGELIQITAPISPGSSGGALFNRNGEVIGVTTLGIIDGQNLNFAVPIERLQTLIDASQPASERRPRMPAHETRPRGGEIASIYRHGLELAGPDFRESREYRAVSRALEELESGRPERALRQLVGYRRNIDHFEFYFFWGLVDYYYNDQRFAAIHLRYLEAHSELRQVLESLLFGE
jgi:hypothetical protein